MYYLSLSNPPSSSPPVSPLPPGAPPPAAPPPVRLAPAVRPLRLVDLVAAVRETGIQNVQAVADRLGKHYDITTGADTLSMVLVAMHTARQDLARYLREDAIRLCMAGMPAEVIVQSALRYFDNILGDQSTY